MSWKLKSAVGVLALVGLLTYQYRETHGLDGARPSARSEAPEASPVATTPPDGSGTAVLARALAKPEPYRPKHTKSATGQEAASEALERPPAVKVVWVRVTGSWVNVRSGPRSSSKRLTSYRRGTRLEVLASEGAWVQVRHPDTAAAGWMHGKFLEKVVPPNDNIADSGARATPG